MGDRSTIEWTDATWNPITGCSKVSPGCAHCYAETLSLRFGRSSGPWTPANAEKNVKLHPDRLMVPARWQRPRMVFVNSMSDLFHELVPDEFVAAVFAVMGAASWHTYQVLTKRPERMREYVSSSTFGRDVARAAEAIGVDLPFAPTAADVFPNVWLGTSIENRRYVTRADDLRYTPAAVRFISAEPLLGSLIAPRDHPRQALPAFISKRGVAEDLDWRDGYMGPELWLDDVDWLIVGGESGAHHRPMRVEWARELRDAATATGTAFFFKQWGGRTPKAGGRELDGRTWDEMPTPFETSRRATRANEGQLTIGGV